MGFTEKLVGMLGTKHDAFGVWDAAIVLAAIGLLVGVDVVLGNVIRRAAFSLFRRGRSDRDETTGTGDR